MRWNRPDDPSKRRHDSNRKYYRSQRVEELKGIRCEAGKGAEIGAMTLIDTIEYQKN